MGIRALSRRRAVFLDRDGVLNRNVWYASSREWESPREPGDLVLHDGVKEALAALRRDGWKLVVVSNQPSHAKGKTSLASLRAVHERLEHELGTAGIGLDASFYCFHHPNGVVPEWSGVCECRKPSPHFLCRAALDLGLELSYCWMIGDRATDVECGTRAGTRTILVDPDHPAERSETHRPTLRARDLADAVRTIVDTEAALR